MLLAKLFDIAREQVPLINNLTLGNTGVATVSARKQPSITQSESIKVFPLQQHKNARLINGAMRSFKLTQDFFVTWHRFGYFVSLLCEL